MATNTFEMHERKTLRQAIASETERTHATALSSTHIRHRAEVAPARARVRAPLAPIGEQRVRQPFASETVTSDRRLALLPVFAAGTIHRGRTRTRAFQLSNFG
jgi:hypothetical protein